MKEELISFETAKLAKEKGFIEIETIEVSNGMLFYSNKPTQSLLQRWLRENHNIHVEIRFITTHPKEKVYHTLIIYFKGEEPIYNPLLKVHLSDYGLPNISKTYEQALEAGLIEALKLI